LCFSGSVLVTIPVSAYLESYNILEQLLRKCLA